MPSTAPAPVTLPRATVWSLSAIALVLSSVTAVSVGLALFALIEDRLLAVLFAAAAVLLDLFKYLAWPVAGALWDARRRIGAAQLVACALLLAAVSGWATYDRLLSSIVGSRAEQLATQQQRIVDLEAARADDARLLEALDGQADSVRAHAAAMRARGMVSKAADLEAAALPRLAEQREQARARRDHQSLELTALRATPAKAAGLPAWLATLLCLGFALALELVPARILATLRTTQARAPSLKPRPPREALEDSAPLAAETADPAPKTTAPAPETVAAALETAETAETVQAARPAVYGDNAELLQQLLQLTAETEPGAPVNLSEFARTAGIGKLRAGQVFRMAVEAGALCKTAGNRYVANRPAPLAAAELTR